MGLPGHWAVLFARAVVVHPAGRGPDSPTVVGIAVAFDARSSLGTRNEYKFRGRMAHGPRACAPTLRRTRRRDRLQARYRLGRAHPWPDRFRTRWTTDRISRCHRMHRSFLTSVAWSHSLSYPWKGLGRLKKGDQGFLAHVALGLTADGRRLPLGVVAL